MGILLYFTLKCNMKYGFHTDAFNQVEKDPLSIRESFLFHVEGGDWETNRPTSIPCAPTTCPELTSTKKESEHQQ